MIKNAKLMKTEYEKCLAGEPFIGSRDPKIVETILHTRRLLAQFNATDYADTERKQALLHEMFGSMGKGVHVDIDFHCEYGKHIFIGDKVIINMNCTFVDNNRIDIGGAILLPGVTIGKNSVIGAGSVVTRSIPANCVAVGNPCRVIKKIDVTTTY